MTQLQQITLQCDLCKWPAKSFKSWVDAKEKGWMTVGQECYYTDRSFHDTHLCPSCVKKIVRQCNCPEYMDGL